MQASKVFVIVTVLLFASTGCQRSAEISDQQYQGETATIEDILRSLGKEFDQEGDVVRIRMEEDSFKGARAAIDRATKTTPWVVGPCLDGSTLDTADELGQPEPKVVDRAKLCVVRHNDKSVQGGVDLIKTKEEIVLQFYFDAS